MRSSIPLWLFLACSAVLAAPRYGVETSVVWNTALEHAGKSSPRAADFNGDGFDDVVLGTGLEGQWGEAVALDGRTGEVLWRRRFADEVLAATPFLDVSGDRVPDVFVNGRTLLRDVFALDGKDGTTLWRLTEANPQTVFLPTYFINLLLVDDRDGDGLSDLVVVQSGGADSRRLAGRFYGVRSKDGSLLSTHVAPDGKESYAIPLFQTRPAGLHRFYVGTGGETLSGGLSKLDLATWDEAWRVRSIGGGFIGSPSIVDLDGDGTEELIAAGMNGAVYRLDAETGAVAWRWHERPYWTYVSPTAGAFNAEPTLDVVAGFNRGSWPLRESAKLVWLDGATGAVIAEKNFDGRSRSTASSPLTLDVDLDGRDETLIVLSNPVPGLTVTNESHRLLLVDGGPAHEEILSLELEGYSIATPRLSDLDGNGKLDVIHTTHYGVMRIELAVTGSSGVPRVRWGELRGPNGAGIYGRSPVSR